VISRTESAPPSKNSCAGHRPSCSSPASLPRTQRSTGTRSVPVTGSACSIAQRTGTSRFSTSRASSNCNAHPIRTSASVAAGRTSAWATSCRRKTELRNLFRELLTRLKTVEFGQAPSGVRRVGDIMRVEVDLDKCTGRGICESIADDVFEVQDDGTVLIHENERPETDRDRMQQAVTQCPAAALRLVECRKCIPAEKRARVRAGIPFRRTSGSGGGGPAPTAGWLRWRRSRRTVCRSWCRCRWHRRRP
jgi:ferredoxin